MSHTISGHKGSVAVYAGSFDPMTLGHLDVIRRAAGLFQTLIVAVGEARGKNPLFSAEERVGLIKDVCADIPNLRYESFSGLTVHFATKAKAVALVRGIRSSADYEYERQMALMNREINKELETIFLPTSAQYSHISSSMAKEIAIYGGDVNLLVPPLVAERLAEKFSSNKEPIR